jgi:hypothetical protein
MSIMANLVNFNETPNLLELIETSDATAITLADPSICGDDAVDSPGLSSSPTEHSLCADEGPRARSICAGEGSFDHSICADEGPAICTDEGPAEKSTCSDD